MAALFEAAAGGCRDEGAGDAWGTAGDAAGTEVDDWPSAVRQQSRNALSIRIKFFMNKSVSRASDGHQVDTNQLELSSDYYLSC